MNTTRDSESTILFIHGIAEIGGGERDLLMILDRLPGFGYRPVVVCPEQGPFVEELRHRGIGCCYATFPPWRKLLSYARRRAAIRRLREIVTSERPSLVHVNDIWWVPQTLRALEGSGGSGSDRIPRMPIVAHVRQEIEPRKVKRYELHRADLLFPVSKQIQVALEAGGVAPGTARPLYSGLDPARIPAQLGREAARQRHGFPQDALVLGTVANLFPRKGYDVMLAALRRILTHCPNVHYLIVGQGDTDYEARLRRLAGDETLRGRVQFTGFQPDVYPLLAAMDLYVHPALMEGFGIAVLEAMAMGIPVIATRTGGLPEIIEERITGVLVPPGDVEALEAAVVTLAADVQLRSVYGAAGRDRVRKSFTIGAMMDGLVAGYQDVQKQASPRKEVSA